MSDAAAGESPSGSLKNPSPSDQGEPPPLIGKRIVIVEDEGVTQMQLRRALTKAGLQVVGAANNGKSAVEVVLRERPDVVLMDVQMPVMDGLEAAQLILAEYRVCVVMLSAFATEEHQDKAKELGACGYLHKPVITETLFSQLEQAWRRFHTQ